MIAFRRALLEYVSGLTLVVQTRGPSVSWPAVSGNGSKSRPAVAAHVLRHWFPATVDGTILVDACSQLKAGNAEGQFDPYLTRPFES
jgi:hypothetical protein